MKARTQSSTNSEKPRPAISFNSSSEGSGSDLLMERNDGFFYGTASTMGMRIRLLSASLRAAFRLGFYFRP